MMMHPDFRALLDSNWMIHNPTVKAYIRPVDYQKQPFLSQNSVSISTRSNSVLVKYNWISLCDLGRIA